MDKSEKKVLWGAVIILSALVCWNWQSSFTAEKKNSIDYNPVPIINNSPARAVNSSFQPTSIRGTFGSYTVTVTTAVSLLNSTSSGKVFFEISPDNTNWTIVNSAGVSRTLSVSITVGVNESTDYNIQGMIPKGYYCRLRTSTSGGGTVSMSSGQETMF